MNWDTLHLYSQSIIFHKEEISKSEISQKKVKKYFLLNLKMINNLLLKLMKEILLCSRLICAQIIKSTIQIIIKEFAYHVSLISSEARPIFQWTWITRVLAYLQLKFIIKNTPRDKKTLRNKIIPLIKLIWLVLIELTAFTQILKSRKFPWLTLWLWFDNKVNQSINNFTMVKKIKSLWKNQSLSEENKIKVFCPLFINEHTFYEWLNAHKMIFSSIFLFFQLILNQSIKNYKKLRMK